MPSFIPPKRRLMGPGPSDISDRVLQALARPTIGHLDPKFIELMDEIKDLLQRAFLTKNAITLPISAPGSAGMEACLVNLLEPGDKIIVAQNGVFGRRMTEVSRRAGATVVEVTDDWGKEIDPQKVRDAFKQNPDSKFLAFVHAETSTGALSDAKTLSAVAHEYSAMAIADTVTSLGGVPLRIDDWKIDATYSGTQKCLSCPPGLSPVSLSDQAFALVKNRKTPVQSWFLDLKLLCGYWEGEKKRAYHHTAPINSLYGLHEALLALHEEGLESSWQRHRRLHENLARGLQELGLSYAVAADVRLPQLNAVNIPAGVDDEKVRRTLLDEFNIEIGAGLGPMAGKIWRIGLMGHACSQDNIDACLKALRTVLGR